MRRRYSMTPKEEKEKPPANLPYITIMANEASIYINSVGVQLLDTRDGETVKGMRSQHGSFIYRAELDELNGFVICPNRSGGGVIQSKTINEFLGLPPGTYIMHGPEEIERRDMYRLITIAEHQELTNEE